MANAAKARRRVFLSELAHREYFVMIEHFKSKKKVAGKKTLTKLERMKMHNLENLLDDYFHRVCFDFWRRQMMIWCCLRLKHLKVPLIDTSDDAQFNYDATDTFGKPIFPLYFSEEQSEPII